jgi:hypothetical protein
MDRRNHRLDGRAPLAKRDARPPAYMSSVKPPTRVSPHAKARPRPRDQDPEPPIIKALRKNQERLSAGSTSRRAGGPPGGHRSDPAAGANSAALRQSSSQTAAFGAFAHIASRVGIIGAAALLVFVFLAAGRSWLLSDPKESARDDVAISTPAQGSSRSTSVVTTVSYQRPDASRDATAAHPSSDPPEQKRAVAFVIPPGAPPQEETLHLQPRGQLPSPPSTAPERDDRTVNPNPQLDLRRLEDAKRIQQRLIALGFLVGAADGAWGSPSRRALQDFRVAKGLGDSFAWDEATQELLLTPSDANASDIGFVGKWGTDAAQCRDAPLTISVRRAQATGAACEFHSTQRVSSKAWRLQAKCADETQSWSTSIRLAISGSKLTWSSARGTLTYARC